MDAFQCISCGTYFPRMLDYYRHRLVVSGVTRCVPVEQMHAAAIKTVSKYVPGRLITAPAPRVRAMFEPNPPVALARAMWLMRRGVSIERLQRMGVDAATMSKALQALEKEMTNDALQTAN